MKCYGAKSSVQIGASFLYLPTLSPVSNFHQQSPSLSTLLRDGRRYKIPPLQPPSVSDEEATVATIGKAPFSKIGNVTSESILTNTIFYLPLLVLSVYVTKLFKK